MQWDSGFYPEQKGQGGSEMPEGALLSSCHRTEYMDWGLRADSSESGVDPVRSR